MNFDFTTETIMPEITSILTIGGTGALELPSGTTAQEPAGVVAGAIRWNTTVPQLEYYNGTSWLPFGGSVTSVQASGGSTGLTFSGGPITSSGTLTLSGTLGVGSGGTGQTATPTNGQILVGNGTNFIVATLGTSTGISTTVGAGTLQINNTGVTSAVAGTGISVSGATGAVTITNTGVTSFSAGTTGLTPSSATTGAVTLAGTLNIANGGTGQTTALAAFNALSPLTTAGDTLYFNGTNNVRLPIGTSGQVLTVASGEPSWATVAAGSYSTTVGPAGVVPWTLVSGSGSTGTYNATVTHNLGTENIIVQCVDITTGAASINDVINPDFIEVATTNTVVIQVIDNNRTLRVVIIANGSAIAAGGSTPSSVLVQAAGVGVTGGPFTTLNFTGYATTPTGASGVATIALGETVQVNGTAITGGPFSTINFVGTELVGSNVGGVATVTNNAAAVIRQMTFVATSFDSPNNADWTVNALAATIADATNNGINVRTFSNSTEQGVGFTIPIPTGATNIIFSYNIRPVTAPGSASTSTMKLYTRTVANVTTPAAVGAWSAATTFTNDTVPTNAFFQTYTHTYTLAALSITAGNVVQFELTRAASGVASNMNMIQLTVTFT